MLEKGDGALDFERVTAVYHSVTEAYTTTLQQLYKEGIAKNVNEVEITTLINFNRETFTACKALVFGVKDHLLDEKQSAYFDELPGFIR
jgi:phosphate:Na+ symporter